MQLSDLLSPFDVDTFFKMYWRKQPLLLSNERSFENLVSIDEIDKYLTQSTLTYPFVRLAGEGIEWPLEKYSSQKERYFNVLEKTKLFELFENGKTMVIQGGQYSFPHLFELRNQLIKELDSSINLNLYITPSGNQGFYPHFDSHDVFVLQVFGSKNWRLYDQKHVNPQKSWSLTDEEVGLYRNAKPNHELTLSRGDLLYFPAGVVHDAYSTDELSIHITIGASYKSNLDFIKSTIEHGEKIDFFREPFAVNSENDFNRLIEQLTILLRDFYSNYLDDIRSLPAKFPEGLFVDYCCVDSLVNLSEEDFTVTNDGYERDDKAETDIIQAIRQKSLKKLILNDANENSYLREKLKGLIRKNVVSINK